LNPRLQPLVAEVRAHREHFDAFARSLDASELARPVPQSEWIVKDYISHLATIDLTVREWFRTLATGEAPPPSVDKPTERPAFDIDAWNNRQVAKRRDVPVGDILAEAGTLRAELLEIMELFSDEVLDSDIPFPGDANRQASAINFGGYLVAWATHDPAHAMDMLRALPERQNEPLLREWIDGVSFQSWPPTARL
jgi:hypothetical protein